jgi:hypothetical protein
MKKKHDATEVLAMSTSARTAQEFAPIRAWAKANPGAIQKLTDKIKDKSGEAVNRHMVGRWLSESNPVQPRYGYGLYLIEAYQELLSE